MSGSVSRPDDVLQVIPAGTRRGYQHGISHLPWNQKTTVKVLDVFRVSGKKATVRKFPARQIVKEDLWHLEELLGSHFYFPWRFCCSLSSLTAEGIHPRLLNHVPNARNPAVRQWAA